MLDRRADDSCAPADDSLAACADPAGAAELAAIGRFVLAGSSLWDALELAVADGADGGAR